MYPTYVLYAHVQSCPTPCTPNMMLLLSCQVVSDSSWLPRLQHTRLLCPSPSPRVCPSSCPMNQWRHPTISSSVTLFCLQSFAASGSFPMNQLFASGGPSNGASALASVLPKTIQGWFPLRLTVLIALLSKGLWKSLLQHHSLKASIPQRSAFFTVQLSHLSMTTAKTAALTIWPFVSKVMSLFCHTMSRFVTAFLPRRNHRIISWL